ncbi:hypothetical protein ACQHGV_03230 [Sphingomonas pseudosanguinis]|uniref:hypothetical protein n=1 Tax=Sphingomonas pseudosanguinis TaxID=413712 RepID=UPI003F84C42F
MRRFCVPLLILGVLAGCQPSSPDDRLAKAEQQERSRQEKAAREMVAQTEDQVRVRMLEQRVAALEAQIAMMQGDRKLLDAKLVEQRLNQIEAQKLGVEPSVQTPAASPAAPAGSTNKAPASPKPRPSPSPAARKPLVLDLR